MKRIFTQFASVSWNVPAGGERGPSQRMTIPATDKGVYLVEATNGVLRAYQGDVTVNAPGAWNMGSESRNLRGHTYTDRPEYRRGDTVHFLDVHPASCVADTWCQRAAIGFRSENLFARNQE